MGWREVESKEELKSLGTLKEIAEVISKELNEAKVPRNSWEKLWQFIASYKIRQQVKDEDSGKEDWQLVSSEKELKGLGISFAEMKKIVGQKVAPYTVKARGWGELYQFIKQRFPDESISNEIYNSLYFKDEVSELIFYLLELDGEARQKKLGITSMYYKDKKQASIWKNELMKKIHPDQSKHIKAEEATKELNELYGSMIKFAK